MQDKPSLISQTQPSSNETVLTDAQSNHRQYVPQHTSRTSSAGKSNGTSSCLTCIPNESLTHITTFLDDPPSLFALSGVNQRLRDHVADDNTWYRAFAFTFLGIGPESEPEHDKILMLRRSEATWKKEFVTRFNLARRWEKSRNSTLSYQPHYWGISSMHLLENVSLLTSNLQYGVITRSFPLTGKILKGHLDASGTTNGFGIGNPNEEFTPNVTCVALSSCGGVGRNAWGFRNGQVASTSAPRVMDSNRPAARYVRSRVEDDHAGQVRCVLFGGKDDELVISACDRGQVKMWDAKRMRCLWTGFTKPAEMGLPDPSLKVEFCASVGAVAVALESGNVIVWWGFELQDDGTGGQILVNPIREFQTPSPMPQASKDGAVDAFFVDPMSSPNKLGMLLHHTGDRYFLRLVVDLSSEYVTCTRFEDGPLGPLTALKPYFGAQVRFSVPSVINTSSLEAGVISRDPSFVLAGDSLGRVCVWDWDATGIFVADKDTEQDSKGRVHDFVGQVSSIRRWDAHDDGAVCVIEARNALIVTGSTRGTMKAWDSLTIRPLRSFTSPATKPSATGEWDPVNQIILRGDLLVASVGSRILVWQAGTVVADHKQKGKHPVKPKGRGTGGNLNKWQQQIELNRDIRESQRLLEDERVDVQRVYGRERDQLSTLDRLGLDEREAVEYLLMLSREEDEQRRASGTQSSGSNEERAVMNDDTECVFALEEHPVQTGSSGSSPIFFPSSVRSTPSGTYPRVTPSASNSKVQVSPPFLPEAMEARLSASPLRLPSGSASPVAMNRGRGSASSTLDDSEQFPMMGSSSGTPSRSVSSLHLAGSWSKGSPSGSFDGRRSSPASSSSNLDASRGPGASMGRDEGDDAELRFVLDLSLVEARSRGEV